MATATNDKLQKLANNTEALRDMVREVNGWDGSLESYEAYEFDDDFFENYFSSKEEVARATFFGDIQNWMDEYIRFNGYGNLESLNDYQYAKELEEGADEIIERFAELADDGKVDADEVLERYSDD